MTILDNDYPIHLNGVCSSSLPISDRGLQYGDGLFETLLLRNGQLELAELHWQRLAKGLAALSFNCEVNAVSRLLDKYLREHDLLKPTVERITVKLLITRGSSQRGYRFSDSSVPNVIIQAFNSVAPSANLLVKGVRLRVCSMRLGYNEALAGLKHLNRLEQVLARSEWDDTDIYDGLMLDRAGWLIEGTMSNLFLVEGGRLITPSLNLCGVAGVMRARIFQLAEGLTGHPVEEADIDMNHFERAKEVFICNSQSGVLPVASCDGSIDEVFPAMSWPVGSVTMQLQKVVSK